MSRNLELPDPIFDALHNAAAADCASPVEWIAAHLPTSTQPPEQKGAKSLADLFSGRTGRIVSGGIETLSEKCGEQFADQLEQQRRKSGTN